MPALMIDLAKLRWNATRLCAYCREFGVDLTLVTKGIGADERIVRAISDVGATFLADSRLSNIARYPKEIASKKLLLRLPSLSQVKETVALCDASLNTEIDVMKALDDEAGRQNKVHGIILMTDLGDLREGIYYSDTRALLTAACFVRACSNLRLLGIGTNLTCFASILPTKKNLGKLEELAEWLEQELRCDPLIISGGNSSSLYLLPSGILPKKINNLRVGEAWQRGVEAAFMEPFLNLKEDAIQLEAELIEVRVKPSMPSGTPGITTWGETPAFCDMGDRRRGILALGRQDTDISGLSPVDEGVTVLGAGSDHTVVDLTDSTIRYQVGDRMRFRLNYPAMMYAFACADVDRRYME